MPATRSYFIEPIRGQFASLMPTREKEHLLLRRHKPYVLDKVLLEKLVQVLVFGCTYYRIVDESCSDTTLRCRRDDFGRGSTPRWSGRCRTACTSDRWTGAPRRG